MQRPRKPQLPSPGRAFCLHGLPSRRRVPPPCSRKRLAIDACCRRRRLTGAIPTRAMSCNPALACASAIRGRRGPAEHINEIPLSPEQKGKPRPVHVGLARARLGRYSTAIDNKQGRKPPFLNSASCTSLHQHPFVHSHASNGLLGTQGFSQWNGWVLVRTWKSSRVYWLMHGVVAIRGLNDTVCVSKIYWPTWRWRGRDRLGLAWVGSRPAAGGSGSRPAHSAATATPPTTTPPPAPARFRPLPNPKQTPFPLLASLERSPSLSSHSTRRAGANASTDAADPSASRAHGSVEPTVKQLVYAPACGLASPSSYNEKQQRQRARAAA